MMHLAPFNIILFLFKTQKESTNVQLSPFKFALTSLQKLTHREVIYDHDTVLE